MQTNYCPVCNLGGDSAFQFGRCGVIESVNVRIFESSMTTVRILDQMESLKKWLETNI